MFATHSIPSAAADVSGPRETLPDGTPVPTGGGEEWHAGGGWYAAQQRAVAALVMDAVADEFPGVDWSLVYQSRSGDPSVPWLEPDINARHRGAARRRHAGSVISPLGFVSDHMEVAWDLDNEALETCEERGLAVVRVPTVGVDPRFVAGLIDLVQERHVADGVARWSASAHRPRAVAGRVPGRLLPGPRRQAHDRVGLADAQDPAASSKARRGSCSLPIDTRSRRKNAAAVQSSAMRALRLNVGICMR